MVGCGSAAFSYRSKKYLLFSINTTWAIFHVVPGHCFSKCQGGTYLQVLHGPWWGKGSPGHHQCCCLCVSGTTSSGRPSVGAAMGLGPHPANRHSAGTPDIGVLPLSLMPAALLLFLRLGPTGELLNGVAGGGKFEAPTASLLASALWAGDFLHGET